MIVHGLGLQAIPAMATRLSFCGALRCTRLVLEGMPAIQEKHVFQVVQLLLQVVLWG